MKKDEQSDTAPETGRGERKIDEMITELFGGSEGFRKMLDTQSTPTQRVNLTRLFDGRFAVDGKK